MKNICATLDTHKCHLHLQGEKIESACIDKLKDNIATALKHIEKMEGVLNNTALYENAMSKKKVYIT